MTIPGRPVKKAFAFALLVFASATIVFAQPKDAVTAAKEFLGEKAETGIWSLLPSTFVGLDVYENGVFVIKASIAGRIEPLTPNSTVVFDSDFYKLKLDKSLPTVKGTFVFLNSKYFPNDVFLAVINDNAIIENNKGKPDKKDQFDQAYHEVSQAGFDRQVEPGDYDTGVPMVKYGNGNTAEIPPAAVVEVFKVVGMNSGTFLQKHPGQTLDQVRLAKLDKTQPVVASFVNDFQKDYLYPFAVTFVFSDKSKEGHFLFRLSSGESVLILRDFVNNWKH